MTRLSVNINKVALLRNARGAEARPHVVPCALDCIRFGAEGITVHPRPDQRHIKRQDVYDLAQVVKDVEFNIEGYPSEDFLMMVEDVKPAQCTLVPDPPDVLTSNAGWDTIKNESFLKETVARLKESGVRTSLFIETDLKMIEGAKAVGTDRIELYTESYARNYPINGERAIEPYRQSALRCAEIDLGVNAGHDLNLENLAYMREQIPNLLEVSIGHALICDALYFGLQETIRRYLQLLSDETEKERSASATNI